MVFGLIPSQSTSGKRHVRNRHYAEDNNCFRDGYHTQLNQPYCKNYKKDEEIKSYRCSYIEK